MYGRKREPARNSRFRHLSGGLAGGAELCRPAVLARIVATHGQVSKARGEKSEGIALALVRVEVIRWTSRSRAVASGLESNLSSTAVKGTSGVSPARWAEVRVQSSWVGPSRRAKP